MNDKLNELSQDLEPIKKELQKIADKYNIEEGLTIHVSKKRVFAAISEDIIREDVVLDTNQ